MSIVTTSPPTNKNHRHNIGISMVSVLSIAIPPFVAVVVLLALTTQFFANGLRNTPWSWPVFGCHLFGIAIETAFLLFLFSLQRWVTLDLVFLLLYALLGLKVLLCLWCWWKQQRVIVYAAWIWLVQYALAIGSLSVCARHKDFFIR